MPDSLDAEPFAEVRLALEPEPLIGYRSALTVYEESLIGGRFVGRSWNGAGFLNDWDSPRLDPAKHPTPQAFWLEIDGQLLASHWRWEGLQKRQESKGLHVVVTLRHAVRPVAVEVHTLLDGTPILTRWLAITNTGQQPAALAAASPWSGVLKVTPRWRAHLRDRQAALYSLGAMADTRWGDEGNFQWQPLPNATLRIDGRYRRDRYRHPMFVLRSNATGEHFIGQLAWSGGFAFEFDLNADLGAADNTASLCFRAGPDAPAPQRILAPDETVATPEMHLGLVFGDLDTAVQAMHTHLRRSVFRPQARGRGGWLESGIGPEVEISAPRVFDAIEQAAQLGAEIFFIDASWYTPPGGDWYATVGDWQVDLARFPAGLQPFRDRVHELGMLWGLWMDAERMGAESRIARQHPEWWGQGYDGTNRLGNLLDIAQPAAAQWMEAEIARLITDQALDFFRLDYNVGGLGAGSQNHRDGFVENGYWRYYQALYGIYDRLRERFPDVVFENCAGGGGRTDVGLVGRFSHTWVTDWQVAPRSFSITNGMTMALPPEYVDRLVGGQDGHTAGDVDFQARLLLFVRPTFGYLAPVGEPVNPVQLARIGHMLDLYRSFVRPFMAEGRMYHHTPAFDGPEPKGWGVLELAAADRTRGIAGVFQLSDPDGSDYLLRLRGLDLGKRYRVTWDNAGQTCEVDGFTLMKQGLAIRLEGALTSELLLFEAV